MNVIYEIENNNSIKDYVFNTDIGDFISLSELKTYIQKILDHLPKGLLHQFELVGWSICITNRRILEKGIIYDISGLTDYENKTIFLYPSKKYIINTLCHELGHLVDDNLGTLSKHDKWIKYYTCFTT